MNTIEVANIVDIDKIINIILLSSKYKKIKNI